MGLFTKAKNLFLLFLFSLLSIKYKFKEILFEDEKENNFDPSNLVYDDIERGVLDDEY